MCILKEPPPPAYPLYHLLLLNCVSYCRLHLRNESKHASTFPYMRIHCSFSNILGRLLAGQVIVYCCSVCLPQPKTQT